jgi:FkbM family methyltransferase
VVEVSVDFRRVTKIIGYELYRAVRPSIIELEGIRLATRDPAISAKMFHVLSQDYEASEVALASDWIEAEDRVLEIGSGVGFVGLYCIKRLGVKNYAMVEANPGLIRVTARNIALNQVEPPALIHAAVTGEDGFAIFHVTEDFWSSSTVKRATSEEAVSVPAMTILTLIAQLPFLPDTLIMDIEGGEVSVPLEHYAAFRKVIVETHARVVGKPAIDALLQGLADLGFERRAKQGLTYVLTRSQPTQ